MANERPSGGIDERKYAVLSLALGLARGALHSAIGGDMEGAQRVFDLTATHWLATALGCSEQELSVDWAEHLSEQEMEAVKSPRWDDDAWTRCKRRR